MRIRLNSEIRVVSSNRVARPVLPDVTAAITSMGKRQDRFYIRLYFPPELLPKETHSLYVYGAPDELHIARLAPARAALEVTLHRRYSSSTDRRAIVLDVRLFTDDRIRGPVRAMPIPWRLEESEVVVDVTPVFARADPDATTLG